MSKRIDMDKPLSSADMRYLLERDRHQEVAFNATVHGTELPEDVAESIRARGITSASVERLVEAAGKLPRSEEPSEPVEPVSGDKGGQEQAATTDDASSRAEEPEQYSDAWFDAATVAVLKAELAKRDLPVSGRREELADRLYMDMDEKGELPDSGDDGNG